MTMKRITKTKLLKHINDRIDASRSHYETALEKRAKEPATFLRAEISTLEILRDFIASRRIG